MTSFDIVFERKCEEDWQPVHSKDLHEGDVARMRIDGGGVLREEDGTEEYRVSGIRGSDPDSGWRFGLALDPVVGS